MFNKNSKNEKSPSLFNRIEQKISEILTLYSGRPLPGISKTSLLVDWLLFRITDYKKNKTDDILKLLKRKIHYRSSHNLNYLITEIFFYKIYYFHSTKPNPRILDCGANIGLATLFFKILYPNSIIEAFEPDPELFSILKRNVTENQLSNVHVYNYALGEKNGIGEFYPNINPTIGQLGKFAPGSLPPIQVTIRRLSEWIGEGVDFLKLDVEGAEWEIVKELFESNCLWKVKEAVIEYHGNLNGEEFRFGEFLSFWEKAGFVSIIKPLPITYPFYQLFKFESNCFPTNFLLRLRKRKEIFPTVENNKT